MLEDGSGIGIRMAISVMIYCYSVMIYCYSVMIYCYLFC